MPAAAIDRRLAPAKSKLKLKCRSLRLGEGSVTRQKSAQIAATGVVRRQEVSTMTPRSPCWRHAAEGRLVGAIGIKQFSLYSEDRGCPAPPPPASWTSSTDSPATTSSTNTAALY
jgi:hypothetical protein